MAFQAAHARQPSRAERPRKVPPELEPIELPPPSLPPQSESREHGTTVTRSVAPCAGYPSEPAIDANFDAQLDVADGGGFFFVPPEVAGGVGPDHLMAMLNNKILIQSRVGATVSNVDLSTFWSPLSGVSLTYPRLAFDRVSDRWIASVRSGTGGVMALLVAVSASDDPLGSWRYYSIAADAGGSQFPDWIPLGYNSKFITLTANMFNVSGGTFAGSKMWVCDKAAALAGASMAVSVFPSGFLASVHGTAGTSPFPSCDMDGSDLRMYLLNDSFTSSGVFLLQVTVISGSPSAPVASGIAGSPFGGTSSLCFTATNWSGTQRTMSQVGEARFISPFSIRVSSLVVRNAKIWATNSGGLPGPSTNSSPSANGVLWRQIDPSLPFPATPGAPGSMLVQDGAISAGANTMATYPSIAVNCAEDVVIGFSNGAATKHPECSYAFRRGADALGFMGPIRLLKSGDSTYWKNFGVGTLAQWGLYGSSAVDPNDDLTLWTLQEYAGQRVGPADNDSRWATRWGSLQSGTQGEPSLEPGNHCPPPASPMAACTCPASPDSGLFDPVNLYSGEVYETAVDLRIVGRGMDFVWARKYRSRRGPNTEMGNGWDWSYDLRVQQSGNDVLLSDGNSRRDLYRQTAPGRWTCPEFFREITLDGLGAYQVTFADTGVWQFNAFDGSPSQGKIRAIVDRNGNALTFSYDVQGRLATIIDTLGRVVSVAFNGQGLIASVTDPTGRSVTYSYYQPGEIGGSPRDLKSVTTPAVTGTPQCNDYPSGKTTVYTYSTGFADERLDHNLLTITDPKGQTFVRNTYAAVLDPADFAFDHLTRQVWGDPSDVIDVVYVPQTPSGSNNGAVVKAIVNDRVGDVKELSYDAGGRLVVRQEYTGRAPDPAAPTTETVNRPANKLRITDPDFYETRWEYNADALETHVVHPNGNDELFTYDESNSDPRARGNLLQHCRLPGPLDGDQSQLCESFEYDTGFGGCCGTNFVTRHVDPRGNVTEHQYDVHGNRIHTTHRIPSIVEDWEYNSAGQVTAHVLPDNGNGHRRRDEYHYYSAGAQNGMLQSMVVDASGFALTTIYEYDSLGRRIRVVDPRGHDALFIFNQLDQVVRERSRTVDDASPLRYERDLYYDLDDNLARVDVFNVDDSGAVAANHHLTVIHDFDLLNRVTKTSREKGAYDVPCDQITSAGLPASEFITTEFAYDGNRNCTLERYGEATNGNQPANVRIRRFDERDLLFQETRGAGSSTPSTSQLDYDGNGNLETTHDALEDDPRLTVTTFDGYDRALSVTDPMGNVLRYHYDANGNRLSARSEGELVDVPGSAGNQRLAETACVYDAMDRLATKDEAFFDTTTGTPIGDGHALTQATYSSNSQLLVLTNDNGHSHSIAYDTADRVALRTDPKGNAVAYAYDADSNVVTLTETEKSDLGAPDQVFLTAVDYDNLDRPVRSVDNVGNVARVFHDSRGHVTRSQDALNHELRYAYDGCDRLVQTIRDMNGNGASAGDAADIVTAQTWDDSSRLVVQSDDNGYSTVTTFDALDRRIGTHFADGTTLSFVLDTHDSVVQSTDANGTVVQMTYDGLERVLHKSILPGPGVSRDTTFEDLQYDGLSRLVRAADDDALVTRRYDSLSHVTLETLNGRTVSCAYDGVGNELGCTYPGGRTLTNTYDALELRAAISDQDGLIADYSYQGPVRVERRDYGNGTRTTYAYDGATPNAPNDFGIKQVVRTTHSRIGSGSILDDRTYAWDRTNVKTRRADVRSGGPLRLQQYDNDACHRLLHSTASPAGPLDADVAYALDGPGNRTSVTGGIHAGVYTMSASSPQPADRQVNQYTATPFGAATYDAQGNLSARRGGEGGERRFVYDYRNRLVKAFATVQRSAPPGRAERSVMVQYQYDPLGRRIAKSVTPLDLGGPHASTQTRYYYQDWRVVEERDGADALQATYVYGPAIDEVLTMTRGGVRSYYHEDDVHSIVALSDAGGAVVERYEYRDFGEPLFLDPAGGRHARSARGNAYLFTGRSYDDDTGLYDYRARNLDPLTGRFTSRDPDRALFDSEEAEHQLANAARDLQMNGMWADRVALGNGLTYAGNSPQTWRDPGGLEAGCSDELYGKKVTVKVCGPDLYNCNGEGTAKKTYSHSKSLKVTFKVGGKGGAGKEGGGSGEGSFEFGVESGHEEGQAEEIELKPCSCKKLCFTYECTCVVGEARCFFGGFTLGIGFLLWDAGYWNCKKVAEGWEDCDFKKHCCK